MAILAKIVINVIGKTKLVSFKAIELSTVNERITG